MVLVYARETARTGNPRSRHFRASESAFQLKDYYDKLKGEAEARGDSGHFAMGKGLGKLAAGGIAGMVASMNPALAVMTLGNADRVQLNADQLAGQFAETFYRNRDAIDQTVEVGVAVAAAVGAAFSGGATAALYAGYAAAAYKASIGAYEGGAAGALAGVATGILAGYAAAGELGGLSLDLNYTYAEGWGASVGYGWGSGGLKGLNVGLSYNEMEGFGLSGGYAFAGGVGLNAGVNAAGGYSAGLNIGGNRSSVNIGYRYSQFSGGTTSLSYTSGNLNNTDFSRTTGLTFNTNDGFGLSLGVGWRTDARTNNFNVGFNRRGVNASFSSRQRQERGPGDGWPGDSVPERRGLLDILAGAGYLSERREGDVIGMVSLADSDEGVFGPDELNQYEAGGALPDGVSTAKEYKHWQAADRAHHILISQNPEKFNNKETWKRIRAKLKPGVNYSDAEIRALVAAEGGDAFNVNEDNVAVVKAGKWDAQRRHDIATQAAVQKFQNQQVQDYVASVGLPGHIKTLAQLKSYVEYHGLPGNDGDGPDVGRSLLDKYKSGMNTIFTSGVGIYGHIAAATKRGVDGMGMTGTAMGTVISGMYNGVGALAGMDPMDYLGMKLRIVNRDNLAQYRDAKFASNMTEAAGGLLVGGVTSGYGAVRGAVGLTRGLMNSSRVFTTVGQNGFRVGARMTPANMGLGPRYGAQIARGGSPYQGYTFHPRATGGSSHAAPGDAIPYRSGKPLLRQTTDNTCGHYSCGMAVRGEGGIFDTFKAVKYAGDRPLTGPELIRVLENQGIRGATAVENPGGATAAMIQELASTRPTIALIESSGPSGGHWVVVDGLKRVGGKSYFSVRNPWPQGAPEYLQPTSSFFETFRFSIVNLPK